MALTTDDIVAIHQLEAFVHHAVDHDDQSLFPLAFTPDAVFDGRATGGPLFEGIEAIMGFFALGKPPHPPTHHMTNCYVYEADGAVRVLMKWLVIDPSSGLPVTGVNEDVVVRTPDGWRVRARVATVKHPRVGAFAQG